MIRPSGDLLGRFAIGSAVAIEIPIGVRAMHFGGQQALIVAIVPFRKVRIHLGTISESGKFAGSAYAQKRADKDPTKPLTFKPRPKK
jgi:hypothetical protein